ncbi:MAG: alpha/beta fold hydrolase [Defluviimonas sp.]|uniref:alpha/beta fold hydrolase n=1 Tax=Albidovulum sp. TaxID=1872424 RepID=UPI002A2525FD|nr:alpha/beta fold hydrolase [Defluviimonas sp.]
MLNRIEMGAPTGRPTLLIAHGLFGSARNWAAIQRRIAASRPTVAVDMRNHGLSPRAESQGYDDMAADLAAVAEATGAPVDLLGHSMGGKAAMQLALTRPELIRRLVVADIAPVAYGHSQSHLIAAMRTLDLATLGNRRDADTALSRTIEDPGLRAFLLQSLDLKSVPPAWRLNLDVLDREMGRITGWPGTEGRFAGPALFVLGADSDYVRPEHRALIRALFPRARIVKIPGAGHWLQADAPLAFQQTVEAFLDAPATGSAG